MSDFSVPGAFGKNIRCKCCNNPWNQEDSLSNNAIACSPCLSDSKGYSGLDTTNFDPNVSLKENFYLWSNGGWKDKNPIPAEYSSWNTFIVLRDLNLDRLKVILDELAESSLLLSEEETKLADFFNTFMDEQLIESQKLDLLQPLLSTCSDESLTVTEKIAKLHMHGVNVFFSIHSTPDKADSQHSLCSLYQSGLGLPDRDYYFDEDKKRQKRKVSTIYYTTFKFSGIFRI